MDASRFRKTAFEAWGWGGRWVWRLGWQRGLLRGRVLKKSHQYLYNDVREKESEENVTHVYKQALHFARPRLPQKGRPVWYRWVYGSTPSHRHIRIDAEREFRVSTGDWLLDKLDLLVDVDGREGDSVGKILGSGGCVGTIHQSTESRASGYMWRRWGDEDWEVTGGNVPLSTPPTAEPTAGEELVRTTIQIGPQEKSYH
jgi:hypothetical protein